MDEREPGERRPAGGLFREEALRHHAGEPEAGDVLRLPPSWTRWTYWLVLGVAAIGLAYLLLGRVTEYADGPALIELEGRDDLTSPSTGTVAFVGVEPGRQVEAGQVLVRLRDEREAAELESVEREFETLLAARLRNPDDETARRALMSLQAQRELAAARVEQRVIRAPRRAVVRDVRTREGRLIREGEVAVTLDPLEARYRVVALLPGRSRPLLRDGMRLRVQLAGLPRAYRWVTVDQIGDQVLGPGEIGRVLGPAVADVVQVPGAAVVVRAPLPGRAFDAGGEQYGYFDGMEARAEAPLRVEPILFTLFPGLRSAFAD